MHLKAQSQTVARSVMGLQADGLEECGPQSPRFSRARILGLDLAQLFRERFRYDVTVYLNRRERRQALLNERARECHYRCHLGEIAKAYDLTAVECGQELPGVFRWALVLEIGHHGGDRTRCCCRNCLYGSEGGIDKAMSVAIFQPSFVRTQFTLMRKGFGTGVWPAYATDIFRGA